MEILSSRQAVPAVLVISRPDAWQLFGMDIGTLQEDQIPGLVLTDDHEQTHGLLARQTSSRRLLLAYGNEGEDLPGGRGQVPVVSISTRTQGTRQISADGAVTSTTDPSTPRRLPLLTRDDAFNRLIDLVRRAAGDDRDRARTHLIGLFGAVGNEDPRVQRARRDLASALF